VLLGYDLDKGYLEIANWWGDKIRKIDINYSLTGALSFRDLPDEENVMLKLIGLLKNEVKTDQYTLGRDGVYHKINSVSLLEELHNAGMLDKNSVEWRNKLEGIIGSEWASLRGDSKSI